MPDTKIDSTEKPSNEVEPQTPKKEASDENPQNNTQGVPSDIIEQLQKLDPDRRLTHSQIGKIFKISSGTVSDWRHKNSMSNVLKTRLTPLFELLDLRYDGYYLKSDWLAIARRAVGIEPRYV